MLVAAALLASLSLQQPALPRAHCRTQSRSHALLRHEAPTASAAPASAPLSTPQVEAAAEPALPAKHGPYLNLKGKGVNLFGFLYGLQSVLVLGTLWWIALTLTELVCRATGWDKDRKLHDWIGKTWSRVNMWLGGCAPSVIRGKENIPANEQAALYVSNHASWFDIPLVAQAIPNQFKFIAANELRNLPLVGKQLRDGKHVLLDRSSRRGQLKSFKESVAYLQRGISIFAFPEGTRSRSGRLMPFKGGVFSMATKADVPIVPISIVGAYATYPSNAILPLLPNSKQMELHIHPAIQSSGKTEQELEELTRAAIVSKLPPESLPL